MFGKKDKEVPAKKDLKTTQPKAQVKTQATTTSANPAAESKPLSKKEALLKDKYQKLEEAKQKVREAQAQKQKREQERRDELKKKHFRALVTFTIGLFVMLTALIALFPSPTMIVFSTLLMFTFFFLGFAFQKAIMQLMVIALACVVITGAFYSIMTQV